MPPLVLLHTGFPCEQRKMGLLHTDLDMLEESRLDCQTELRHKILLAGRLLKCPSGGTRSRGHRSHCRNSRRSTVTLCSPLEDSRTDVNKTNKPLITLAVGRSIYHLPQSFSSDPSMQSLCRSHLRSLWTHSPVPQENCLGEQGLGTGGRHGVTAGLVNVPETVWRHDSAHQEDFRGSEK